MQLTVNSICIQIVYGDQICEDEVAGMSSPYRSLGKYIYNLGCELEMIFM